MPKKHASRPNQEPFFTTDLQYGSEFHRPHDPEAAARARAEKQAKVDQSMRLANLKSVNDLIRRSSHGMNLKEMTPDHPDYYDFDDMEGIIERAEQNLLTAEERLILACGKCALSGECTMKGDFKKYKKYYRLDPDREELEKALEQDPNTRCDYIVNPE